MQTSQSVDHKKSVHLNLHKLWASFLLWVGHQCAICHQSAKCFTNNLFFSDQLHNYNFWFMPVELHDPDSFCLLSSTHSVAILSASFNLNHNLIGEIHLHKHWAPSIHGYRSISTYRWESPSEGIREMPSSLLRMLQGVWSARCLRRTSVLDWTGCKDAKVKRGSRISFLSLWIYANMALCAAIGLSS